MREFSTANLPTLRKNRPAHEANPAPIDTDAIAAGLDRFRKAWQDSQKSRIAAMEKEIVETQGDIRASERVIEVVKEGGREVADILRQYPYGKSRYTWLKGARAYIAEKEDRIREIRGEIDFEKRLLDEDLPPLPQLNINTLKIGDWGVLTDIGEVSQTLDQHSFLAMFGERQLHFQKFDIDNIADDELFQCTDLCVVSGKYAFENVVGARRTVLSIEPFDKSLLPKPFENVLKRRKELFDERDAEREKKWAQTVAQSERAIHLKLGYPQLGTKYEPQTIIEILEGGISIPNFPKRYRTERFEQVIHRQPPASPVVMIHTRTVETEESKKWRAEQIRNFNEKKSVFPAIVLRSLIEELTAKLRDTELVFNRKGQFREDVEKLDRLVFERFGIKGRREQEIPWKDHEKQEVIDQLRRLAVQYGQIDYEAIQALAHYDATEEEQKKNADIARLKEKLRLKAIALEREKQKASKNDAARGALEREIADLKKQIEGAAKAAED